MKPTFRPFSEAIEALAREWARSAETRLDWTVEKVIFGGESRPEFVRCGELLGVAKPGKTFKPDDLEDGQIPRAAHEKIASDLAFLLGLPVPPVTLWRRPGGEPASISLLPFDQVVNWKEARLGEADKGSNAAALSALIPFDLWIEARDRRKPENIIVDANDAGKVAAVDYAFSMFRYWAAGESVKYQPFIESPDRAAIDLIAEKIVKLSESQIMTVVERIPAEFLTVQQLGVIRDGLIRRKKDIGQLVDDLLGF